MKNITILGILFALYANLMSQDIPIGTWRTHFAGRLAKTGAVVNNEIFVGCELGMYSYHIGTKAYKKYSKSDGLTGYQINRIAKDETSGTVVITYSDGQIDLYKEGVFTNIADFYNYDFSGSKETNHINIINGIAYISTNAGLLLLDINKREVKETYSYIGPNATLVTVACSAIKEDSLFISTNNGIMVGKLSPTINLQNYNKWTTVPSSGQSASLVSFNNQLFAVVDNSVKTVTSKQVSTHETINSDNAAAALRLQLSNGNLVVINTDNLRVYNSEYARVKAIDQTGIKEVVYVQGNYYSITDNDGLVLKEDIAQKLYPSSPHFNYVGRFSFFDNKVFVAPAYMSLTNIDKVEGTGFYIFDNYGWTNVLPRVNNPDFKAVFSVHLKNDTLLLANKNGLVKMPYSKLSGGKLYADTNSNLTPMVGDLFYFSDIAEDSKGNVYASQALRREGDYSFIKANTMIANNFQLYTQDRANSRLTRRLLIDDNDYKWLVPFQTLWDGVNFYGRGVTVYNDAYPDKFRVLSNEAGKGSLTHNYVNAACKTLNGEIWLGTNNGVCVIDDPTRIFSSAYIPDARLPVYNYRALLRDKIVEVITVDAANRKWIATSGDGVWLFSANGDSLIYQFNTSNSPLPSNRIHDIGINPINGEVFFATDKGLVSYRADASSPNLVSDERVYAVKAFPNPVRPDFDGTIGLSGLGPNAIVKITDVSGKLVYETKANGGMATWDAKDQNGNRVATGIYVVFSATADGQVGIVTKIAVVN